MTYWVAGATVVGAVGSAAIGSKASKKAAGAATAGEQAAIDEARRQFNLVRGDTANQRFIGDSATNALARLYGYGPPPGASYGSGGVEQSGAPLYQAPPMKEFFNNGAGAILNPYTVTSKLGDARYVLDPAGKLFGNLFGNKHGDEKRNIKAFLNDNKVYDLGDGKLALADGTIFDQSQLQHVAGTYYGATYAPDGNQADWQQRYQSLIGGLQKMPTGNAGGGLTSEGVPNSAPMTAGPGMAGGTPGKPDMSVFFESPDYQFNLNEGQKAIDRSAAARGGLLSGGAVREGARYASGLASREYSNFVDRLMQQAGLGATGIGASASAGANTAGMVGNAAINGANARGSAYLTGANALNSSVQGGLQNFLLAKYLGG